MHSPDQDPLSHLWDQFLEKPLHKERVDPFVRDGILDLDRWNKLLNHPRVLFLNKEAYSDPGDKEDWDLRDFILNEWHGPHGNMWWRMAEIAYLVKNFKSKKYFSYKSISEDECREALLSSAFVNIKKSGGKSSSEEEQLRKYWEQDNELIIEQINIINPGYIVLGGIGHIIKDKLEMTNVQESKEEYFMKSSKIPDAIIINYWHPAYQIPADMFFYTLAYQLNVYKTLLY